MLRAPRPRSLPAKGEGVATAPIGPGRTSSDDTAEVPDRPPRRDPTPLWGARFEGPARAATGCWGCSEAAVLSSLDEFFRCDVCVAEAEAMRSASEAKALEELDRALEFWRPPGVRSPPPPHRRPRRRRDGRREVRQAPTTPSPPPTPGEDLRDYEYMEIPPMVRRRAPDPKSDDPEYLRVVAAAFSVYRRPGRRRDRPTNDQVQAAVDRLRGGESAEGGNALYPWFDRFRKRTGETVKVRDAIDDARALRDAELAVVDRRVGTRGHKRVTK